MKKQGKFKLLTPAEFQTWLDNIVVTRKITLIQNHHTYLPDYKSFAKVPDALYWMESMEQGHKERGFSEIAQQLTTFPNGTICTGRSFDIMPAGIKGANSTGICIEHLGNFDFGGDTMTPVHRNTIINLNAALCDKFKLQANVRSIVYHHWYDLNTGVRWVDFPDKAISVNKTCPGTNFFGGNMPYECEKNFIPLINQAL